MDTNEARKLACEAWVKWRTADARARVEGAKRQSEAFIPREPKEKELPRDFLREVWQRRDALANTLAGAERVFEDARGNAVDEFYDDLIAAGVMQPDARPTEE